MKFDRSFASDQLAGDLFDEQRRAVFKTRGLQLCHRRIVRIELAVCQWWFLLWIGFLYRSSYKSVAPMDPAKSLDSLFTRRAGAGSPVGFSRISSAMSALLGTTPATMAH
jgi:hypothetical protein